MGIKLTSSNYTHVTDKNIPVKDASWKNTITYKILNAHNTMGKIKTKHDKLRIKFDALTSHDITYVGIIQTARASGLTEFPIPYALTNCHNSLGAVGGTINEDDHAFGFSAAVKYGGIFVPAHMAVIHQYMREQMSGCGKMILGSDSHTRYGALGTMAIGEGGGELAKQILNRTYDIDYPEVIAVKVINSPKHGVGPMDVALALVGAVFKNGFVKNKVLEFIGEDIQSLSVDFRNGIDVMTTETSCLSTIWQTDDKVREYFKLHGRESEYAELTPGDNAEYDGLAEIDLSQIKPMIALPFHPSNVYTINEFNNNTADILSELSLAPLIDKLENGRLKADQAVIAGCAGGTFENIMDTAAILDKNSAGSGQLGLSVYPASQPLMLSLTENGCMSKLMRSGATIRSAFCGPCFGACDTPANNGFSIRHVTRNFPNREGSKPGSGQNAFVAIMDARSIAATAANNGNLTPADGIGFASSGYTQSFDGTVYKNRVYNGYKNAKTNEALVYGPNICDWPEMPALPDNLLIKIVSYITDPVTTTDELIPSGETSSYRSNPMKLAEFTLSRKDPAYVQRAKDVQAIQKDQMSGASSESREKLDKISSCLTKQFNAGDFYLGSAVCAVKPGDGSAREQAASCQRVLGGCANFAVEYATKRYRSNLINWGILPFLIKDLSVLKNGDYVFIQNLRDAVKSGDKPTAYVFDEGLSGDMPVRIELDLGSLTDDEREILLSGCLINYYR